METVLYALRVFLEGHPKCSAVVDATDAKTNISFKFDRRVV